MAGGRKGDNVPDKKKTPIMPTIWTEERIREEMRRLDKKTGLHGADLPIEFFRGRSLLGQYCLTEDKGFRFSVTYLDDPNWSEQSALDLIRHEYAHYMDHVLNGTVRPPFHGTKWKACCSSIGGRPIRCYDAEVEMGYKKRSVTAASTAIRYGAYEVGKSIVHPTFGRGMIVAANGEGPARILDVKFEGVGVKRLGTAWVDKNCEKC